MLFGEFDIGYFNLSDISDMMKSVTFIKNVNMQLC